MSGRLESCISLPFRCSKRRNNKWHKWRASSVNKGNHFCHYCMLEFQDAIEIESVDLDETMVVKLDGKTKAWP